MGGRPEQVGGGLDRDDRPHRRHRHRNQGMWKRRPGTISRQKIELFCLKNETESMKLVKVLREN